MLRRKQTTPPVPENGTVTAVNAAESHLPKPGEMLHRPSAKQLADAEKARGGLEQERAAKSAERAKRVSLAAQKPPLTSQGVVEYIDWITTQVVGNQMQIGEAQLLLTAAQLVISTQHADAQGAGETPKIPVATEPNAPNEL